LREEAEKMPKFNNASPSPIVVVFDINGCLASTTIDRRSRGRLTLRPGVAEIARLEADGRFLCALWSSAMRHNAEKAGTALREATGLELETLLSREHTTAAPTKEVAHMTVKPLEARFTSLARVILVDDVPEKAAKGEEANLIAVPPWHGNEKCAVLSILVDRLLAADFTSKPEEGEEPAVEDVRSGVLGEISKEVSTMGFPPPAKPKAPMELPLERRADDWRGDNRREERREERRESRRDERRDDRRDGRRDGRWDERRDTRREERREERRGRGGDGFISRARSPRRGGGGGYADY